MTKRKILTFGASSSKHSINKRLAAYVANRLEEVEIDLIDLNDFEMPIYSIDKEKEMGFPELAYQFKKHISECDAIIISFAEHNGAYTAAFKNIFDWISRIDKVVWDNKPMFLLSTSDGARGAMTVLELATNKFRRMNSAPVFSFSLPSFHANFDEQSGIVNSELERKLDEMLGEFSKLL